MKSVLTVVLMLVATASPAHAEDHGKFVNLGEQITSSLIQGTTFTRDPAGRDLACTVIRGQPAKLLVYDLRSGELLHRLALDGAKGAWNAATATDGSVYVGTDDNGHLYRWIPGEEITHDLGQVLSDQTFAWEAAAGADGEVFVGTYPGCNVVRYHPKDGFSDVGKGAVAPGENYARGVAYGRTTGKVFVSVGAHAHLIELDPKTGAKRDILPADLKSKSFAYAVDAVGEKLFVQISPGDGGIVMDTKSLAVEASLPSISGQMVVGPPSPRDGTIYYYGDNGLCTYDPKTHAIGQVQSVKPFQILGMMWIEFAGEADFPGATLVLLGRPGQIVRFNPATGKSDVKRLKVPPEPTLINAIERGPDGVIYCGGYLSGGVSSYDPATGKHEQHGGMSQAEDMTVLGTNLYLGVYPQARLFRFDVSKRWDAKAGNPKQLESLEHVDQSRPMSALGVPSLKKVFFGTVPEYGMLGGGLATVDGETDAVDFRRNVVENQSIISLTYANGQVVGGTSRSGGLGVEPNTLEAKLFLWDPKTATKTFETAPVPGAWMITGLMVGPDGNIWGVADETLFVYDVANKKVIATAALGHIDENDRHARWRDATMALHPDGNIYAVAGGRLVRIDPATKAITILRDKSGDKPGDKTHLALMAMDQAGRIYLRDRTHLLQYTP
jgi:outer membrane protein assembly factor BamB